MLNWIVWNETDFDIETLLILNWIVLGSLLVALDYSRQQQQQYKTVLTFNCVNKICTYTKLN